MDGRSVVVSFVTVTEMRLGAINAGWCDPAPCLERALAQLVVQPDDDSSFRALDVAFMGGTCGKSAAVTVSTNSPLTWASPSRLVASSADAALQAGGRGSLRARSKPSGRHRVSR